MQSTTLLLATGTKVMGTKAKTDSPSPWNGMTTTTTQKTIPTTMNWKAGLRAILMGQLKSDFIRILMVSIVECIIRDEQLF